MKDDVAQKEVTIQEVITVIQLIVTSYSLASCLIYARAFVEYVCGCVLFQDVTVREIRGR